MVYVFSTSVLAGFGANILVMRIVAAASYAAENFGRIKDAQLHKAAEIAILILVISDLFLYGSKFLVPADPEVYFGRNELIQFFQKDEEKYFRTYMLPNTMLFNRGDIYKFFDNQSDASLTLGVYSDLVEMFKARDPNLNQAGERAIIRINNSQLLTLFNTKYVISEGGIGDSEESHEVAQPKINLFADWDRREPTKIFKEVHVYERYHYLPRAFMVYQSRVLRDKSEIEKVLTSEEFDPFNEVILETEQSEALTEKEPRSGTDPQVRIASYDTNDITVEVDNPADGFLVLSEIYYPGWKAFVDGRETKVLKADYALRAIQLSEGKHTVRFTFDPLSFKIGALLSILGLGVLFLVVATHASPLLKARRAAQLQNI
jgi:hypothetical protein